MGNCPAGTSSRVVIKRAAPVSGSPFSFPELVHVYFQYNRKNGSYFKLADYCCSEDFFNVNEMFPPILSSSKT